MIKKFWKKGFKQKVLLLLIGVFILFFVFIQRDSIQPLLLWFRRFFSLLMVATILFSIGIVMLRSRSGWRKIVALLPLLVLFGLWYLLFPVGMYQHMKQYSVFNSMDLVEINKLPLTRNERIQPYNNIITMAYESISETDEVSHPQLVRIDSINKWTMAIQPAKEYFWQRATDNTEEVFSVESDVPFPIFGDENRVKVTFSLGESLAFSRNTYNAVTQKFNFWQMFVLEPDQLFYMKNDDDQWVQVVSLIKWKGLLFPYPTFGGVMVLQNGEHGIKDYFERLLWGKGEFISPKDISNYPYLKGQNTLSERVSRIQAESMKFLGGFTDPLPWNMKTAVKIPDMPDDQNQQPFVTDCDFVGVDRAAYTGLYHWFGLEPVGEERTNLAISLFIPSDGTNRQLYYNHGKRKQGYAGVSAMPLKIMESKKEVDWNINKPVEFRPFIKDIGGERRMFILTTVIARREGQNRFDGTAEPDIAVVDVKYRNVIWLNARKPLNWESDIELEMSEIWGTTSKFEIIQDSLNKEN